MRCSTRSVTPSPRSATDRRRSSTKSGRAWAGKRDEQRGRTTHPLAQREYVGVVVSDRVGGLSAERGGTLLVAARGWSRHGQSVMRSREGVPELVGLYLTEWRREQWLGPDLVPMLECAQRPTGRRHWLIGPSPEVPAPDAPHTPPASAAPAMLTGARRPGSWAQPDRRFLSALPVGDPPRLLAGLLAAHPPTRFQGVLDQVAGVLACGRYPAMVVAALARALTNDETIRVVDDVADLWGRPCRALRRESGHDVTHELLLDPSATTYRGHHEIAGPHPSTPVPPGTLLRGDVLAVRDHVPPGTTPAELDHDPPPAW